MRFTLALLCSSLFLVANAWSHEGASVCDAAVSKQPSIERIRAEVQKKPKAVGVRIELADKLVSVGCYDEAVHTLESSVELFPNERALQARLKTAQSYLAELAYLEKQAQAKDQTAPVTKMSPAEVQRLLLRCKQVGDVNACDQAIAAKPEASLWIAKGDAHLKANAPREALQAFNRAKQVATSGDEDATSRINATLAILAAQSPPSVASAPQALPQKNAARDSTRTAALSIPRFSNIEPPSRSN